MCAPVSWTQLSAYGMFHHSGKVCLWVWLCVFLFRLTPIGNHCSDFYRWELDVPAFDCHINGITQSVLLGSGLFHSTPCLWNLSTLGRQQSWLLPVTEWCSFVWIHHNYSSIVLLRDVSAVSIPGYWIRLLWTFLSKSVDICFHFSWVNNQRWNWWVMEWVLLTWQESSKLFSEVGMSFYTPTCAAWHFELLYSLRDIWLFRAFNFRSGVSLITYEVKHSAHAHWPFLYIILWSNHSSLLPI